MLSTCLTTSITVPSTHLMAATILSVNRGFCGLPQMASASSFSCRMVFNGSPDPFAFSMRSTRSGLMAIPLSVTITSISFAGSAEGGHLIAYNRDPVAEQRDRKDYRFPEKTVLPAADSVQQIPVGMGDHVRIEIEINLCGTENDHIDHAGKVSFAVVVIAR